MRNLAKGKGVKGSPKKNLKGDGERSQEQILKEIKRVTGVDNINILETRELNKIVASGDGKMPIYVISYPNLSKSEKEILRTIKKHAIVEIGLDPESIED